MGAPILTCFVVVGGGGVWGGGVEINSFVGGGGGGVGEAMVGRLLLALGSPLLFSFWAWLSLFTSRMPSEPFILLTCLMAGC